MIKLIFILFITVLMVTIFKPGKEVGGEKTVVSSLPHSDTFMLANSNAWDENRKES